MSAASLTLQSCSLLLTAPAAHLSQEALLHSARASSLLSNMFVHLAARPPRHRRRTPVSVLRRHLACVLGHSQRRAAVLHGALAPNLCEPETRRLLPVDVRNRHAASACLCTFMCREQAEQAGDGNGQRLCRAQADRPRATKHGNASTVAATCRRALATAPLEFARKEHPTLTIRPLAFSKLN